MVLLFSVPGSVLSGAALLVPVSQVLCVMMLHPLGTDSAQASIAQRRGRGRWMDGSMCRRVAPSPLLSVRMGGCMYGSVGVC